MKNGWLLVFLLSLALLSCSSKDPISNAESSASPPPKSEEPTSSGASEDWQAELQAIDSSIRKKTNQMNLHLAKAARAQDQGDRLQFQQGNLLDARRYWQIADYNKEQAELLEKEIQLLKIKRNQILKEHGIKDTTP